MNKQWNETDENGGGSLLQSVFDRLDVYQEYLSQDRQSPNVSRPMPAGRVAKQLLFEAVRDIANHGQQSMLMAAFRDDVTMPATETSSAWNTLSSIRMMGSDVPMPADEASLNTELGLGSVRDPLWTAIPMTILYVLILVTGVIGNVLTCVVIVRNRYMHTATNYYLFSLAISDLLLLVLGLPQEIYHIWHRYPYMFGEVFCILRGFTSEASTNSSVLTITAFTMERYIAICHPLRAHTMSKLSRAIKLIVIIWLLGFLCAAPIAYQFGIVYDVLHDEIIIPQSASCNIKRSIPYLEVHIFALQSLLVFVLPVTLISVLYTLIGIKLRQSSQDTQHQTDKSAKKLRRRPIKRIRSGSKNSSSIESIEIMDDQSQRQQKQATVMMVLGNESPSGPHYNVKGMLSPLPSGPDSASIPVTDTVTPAAAGSEDTECQSYQLSAQHTVTLAKTSRVSRKIAKMKSASTTSNASSTTGSSLAQRRAVIKMLTAVVVAFFVCFAPFHAQRLMAIYVKNPSNYETIAFAVLTHISGVTYYLSATINPILYSIMSVRFRQAFHDTFIRTFCSSISDQFEHRGRSMSQMYASNYNHHGQYHTHSTIIDRHHHTISGGGNAGTAYNNRATSLGLHRNFINPQSNKNGGISSSSQKTNINNYEEDNNHRRVRLHNVERIYSKKTKTVPETHSEQQQPPIPPVQDQQHNKNVNQITTIVNH